MVCNCLEITRGTLSAAAGQGRSSVEDLAQRTGASTVCGSCRPLLAELAGDRPAAAASQGRTGLLLTAAFAALLALTIASGSPVPPAESVRTGGIWDVLYRDGWWRKATGFALLGCALAAAAGFSLRKRWKFTGWGTLSGGASDTSPSRCLP